MEYISLFLLVVLNILIIQYQAITVRGAPCCSRIDKIGTYTNYTTGYTPVTYHHQMWRNMNQSTDSMDEIIHFDLDFFLIRTSNEQQAYSRIRYNDEKTSQGSFNEWIHNIVPNISFIEKPVSNLFGNLSLLDNFKISNSLFVRKQSKKTMGLVRTSLYPLTARNDYHFVRTLWWNSDDITHEFILDRNFSVTLRLYTDEFSGGLGQCSEFECKRAFLKQNSQQHYKTKSGEVTELFNWCIRDKESEKRPRVSTTHIKDNFENEYIVYLTGVLLLFYGFLGDKLIQSSVAKLSSDQNSDIAGKNRKNENAHDSLLKEGLTVATPNKSDKESKQPIAGGEWEDSVVSEDGPGFHTSNINDTITEHGARIGISSDVSNVSQNPLEKPGDQPSNDHPESEMPDRASLTVEEDTLSETKETGECVYTKTASMHSTSKRGNAVQEDELVCKICYMEEISVVFLPCSHMLACESCSELLQRCAVCRALIKAMFKAEIK